MSSSSSSPPPPPPASSSAASGGAASSGNREKESPCSEKVQYVVIEGKERGGLSRQPSYCKILKDLKEAEEDVMKGEASETIEVTTSEAPVQTITINGQQYQIVSPASLGGNAETATSVVQYATAASSNGQTVFIPGTVPGGGAPAPVNNSSSSSSGPSAEDVSRKREIRLLKNREAARECRNKKKEYIRCLENRVAVLENQNKALIEELKSLKELYTGQKNN